MKLITKYQSSNFNFRSNSNISIIIIHYTSLRNEYEAINYLCNPKNKVSSHYLISQKGQIFSLVNNKFRAWHAGRSKWNDELDINSISIGIELDFSYDFSNNKYSVKMIKSLNDLIENLINKYNINKNNILAHSDVAPYRKIDPGHKFPWHKINSLKIKNNKFHLLKINLLNQWLSKHNFITTKRKVLFILKYIGYDVSKAQIYKKSYNKLILAYKSRYLQNDFNSIVDEKMLSFLKLHLVTLILTKY